MKRLALLTILSAAAALSGCVSEGTYKNMESTYQSLNSGLQAEVGADQVQITQLQNLVRVSLASSLLFAEGSVQLHTAGQATLGKIAPVLKTLSGQQIQIKGFTDNLPIGPELRQRFPTNVALSQARADEVMRVLAGMGVPASMMRATGYGDAQPVASNDTPQGRAKNRRVEIDIAEAK